ncbi:MAG: hypothetical protein PHE51_03290 [Eubacteriales bacterium]|nr:hypothetical protein [Eubacteriales bacterium]
MRDERIIHIEKLKSRNFKEVIFVLRNNADEDNIITEAYDIINKYDKGAVYPRTAPTPPKNGIMRFLRAFWF